MNRSQNFAMTKGLAKMGSDFFDNKLTGINCIPAAFSAVISIPIFALAVAGDMVYGALKAMGNGLSLLAQRTVKVAPLPSAASTSSTPSVATFVRPNRNDPAALVKYFLTTANDDACATSFKAFVKAGDANENANFMREFYNFQAEPTLVKAQSIYATFIDNTDESVAYINIAGSLKNKIDICISDLQKLNQTESKESKISESEKSNISEEKKLILSSIATHFEKVSREVIGMFDLFLIKTSEKHPEIERESTASKKAASNSLPPPSVDSSHDLTPPPVPSLSSDSEPTFLSSTYVQNSVDAETLSSPVTVHTEPKQNS